MLLSYFKPELADDPKPESHRFPARVRSEFDPMSQSTDVHIDYATREIANPAPNTDDLIAATAAIVRKSVEAARRHYNQLVEHVVIGVPSYQASTDNAEAKRAIERRKQAIAVSGIAEDFGTADFTVETFGEAQAAGYGIDIEGSGSEAFSIVIDCGAGTTDMALVHYKRGAGRRLVASEPILHDTVRFAGRELNEAIARWLQKNREVRKASQAMDGRSWQIFMDQEVEYIKRKVSHEEEEFRIRFRDYGDAVDTGLWYNEQRDSLGRVVYVPISLNSADFKEDIRKECRPWIERTAGFFREARAQLGTHAPVAIELVGGAFKFEPLVAALRAAGRQGGLDDVPIRYRTQHDESQTVVARGLARRASISD